MSVHSALKLPFLQESLLASAGAGACSSRRAQSWLPAGPSSEVLEFPICRWDVNPLKPDGMEGEEVFVAPEEKHSGEGSPAWGEGCLPALNCR